MQPKAFPAGHGHHEGVVAIHGLTNGLVAAVFTTGHLRVVRLSDFSSIQEVSLLSSESKLQMKVSDARLCSKTCMSVINKESFNKTIRLCLAYEADGSREVGRQWRVCTFDLTFENV